MIFRKSKLGCSDFGHLLGFIRGVFGADAAKRWAEEDTGRR